MKKELGISTICAALFFLTGCQAIGAIFKAGMWWGIILAVIVIALIIWILGKIMGK